MYTLQITVNSEPIEVTHFPKEIITNTVVAMLQSLWDVDDIKTAVIELKELKEDKR
jgi:hypothetical protein